MRDSKGEGSGLNLPATHKRMLFPERSLIISQYNNIIITVYKNIISYKVNLPMILVPHSPYGASKSKQGYYSSKVH